MVSKGNPKTFRIELSTMLKIYDSKKLIFTNNFLEISNYNNMSSKFDLGLYEKNTKKDLAVIMARNISIYLNSLN